MKDHDLKFSAGKGAGVPSSETAMKSKALLHMRRRLHSRPTPSLHACPDDLPCCIADGLYVGGIAVARNLGALQAAGISHVVNASPLVPCFHTRCLRYHVVAVFDDEEEDICQFFESTNRYIARGRRKGAVLVHCFAGQSRSVALLLAYLIAYEDMTVEGALGLIQASRPAAAPNAGFMRQLQHYEASLGRGGESPRRSVSAATAAAAGLVPECGVWEGQAETCSTAPSSPYQMGLPFPFDDQASLQSPRGADSVCAPSPQSSMGGRTPQAAADPISCWQVPEFSLITGFESPPSSPEWGSFSPSLERWVLTSAPAATSAPSTWPWKQFVRGYHDGSLPAASP